ncbi:rho GTPase activating protein at 71E isoform X2 [Arctopsyche grandis]|uniref:rho GTPase activating protein at 71E isoform X2 n=1 Tax=Arctopsyche grandis TaxID=121162 RepID=UPI00406D63DB
MSGWARRWQTRLGGCAPAASPAARRLDKVKFGAPLAAVCAPAGGLPAPLLVLILKLNKEAPLRKDVFRAPGHQGAMKKLIHFLQTGRLVNVDNYSVYTIASVLKKFLRKLPGGVFGPEGEMILFNAVELPEQDQIAEIRRLVLSLPSHTQQLLVLLFGTFRVMASSAERAGTGMTAEALGVSVAPSFFHSCVSDGRTATMQDVQRFKVATRVMRQLIERFSCGDVFGRDNYEYYARVTGRVLRVADEWICSFRYPPPPRYPNDQQLYARKFYLEAEKTWLQCECNRWGNTLDMLAKTDECQSMPALADSTIPALGGLGCIPEHTLLDSCTRLSVSLEDSVFKVSVSSSSQSSRAGSSPHMTLEELRAVNHYAESTRSLSYLPQVHERQRARMRTRSEWFLQPAVSLELRPPSGGERRSSRRRSRRACAGRGTSTANGARLRALCHSDAEVSLPLLPRCAALATQ